MARGNATRRGLQILDIILHGFLLLDWSDLIPWRVHQLGVDGGIKIVFTVHRTAWPGLTDVIGILLHCAAMNPSALGYHLEEHDHATSNRQCSPLDGRQGAWAWSAMQKTQLEQKQTGRTNKGSMR